MSPHPPYHPSQHDLDELRKLLPHDAHEVLVDAFEEGLTNKLLSRWLVARKGDIKAAAAMLEKHITWRRGPGRPVPEEHHGVQVNLKHQKVFLQGLDRSGRPIVLGVGSRHRKFDTKEDALAFCVYALDTAVAIGDSHADWDGKLTGVFDLRNLSLKNLDLTALQVMFELLQNHYPERLGRLFLYEAPMAFYAIWRAVSPFVDPVTKTKINFVFAKNAHDEFEKVFDLHLLPRDLGGEGDYHPIEEAHREAMQRLAARGNAVAAHTSGTTVAAAAEVTSAPPLAAAGSGPPGKEPAEAPASSGRGANVGDGGGGGGPQLQPSSPPGSAGCGAGLGAMGSAAPGSPGGGGGVRELVVSASSETRAVQNTATIPS